MTKICLIIGGGSLPREILKKLKKDEVFVVALKEADVEFANLEGYEYEIVSFVKVGKILRLLKAREISTVCFAGSVKKPSFFGLKPDFSGFLLLFQLIRLKSKGDDAVLKAVIKFMDKRNISLKGAGEICTDLIVKRGVLTNGKPHQEAMKDGELGRQVVIGLSKFDIGQSVVIQEGVVIGVEAVEGTDSLIERCSLLCYYKSKNRPILVKHSKEGQTLKIDMPTIGFKTIDLLIKHNFAGVFMEAEKTLFLEQEKSIELANKHNIFIVGI
jgi:DUF1009 family protein